MWGMSAKRLELVSHVYNPPGLDCYAEMLRWQWASLVRHPPPVMTDYTVVFTGEDEATCKVVEWMFTQHVETVVQRPTCVAPERLFRRAIIRNERCKRTEADVVWMTDVDYVFGHGCLEDVARHMGATSGLCMPETVRICKDVHDEHSHRERPDHAAGDAMLERERHSELPALRPDEFLPKSQKMAIGGVQIVGGNLARRIGYLDGTKWIEPVSVEEGFRSCRCDKVWRSANNLQAVSIPIRGVYRLRHSRDGRDYDYRGVVKGKQVW